MPKRRRTAAERQAIDEQRARAHEARLEVRRTDQFLNVRQYFPISELVPRLHRVPGLTMRPGDRFVVELESVHNKSLTQEIRFGGLRHVKNYLREEKEPLNVEVGSDKLYMSQDVSLFYHCRIKAAYNINGGARADSEKHTFDNGRLTVTAESMRSRNNNCGLECLRLFGAFPPGTTNCSIRTPDPNTNWSGYPGNVPLPPAALQTIADRYGLLTKPVRVIDCEDS
jgi:hypothetical protein